MNKQNLQFPKGFFWGAGTSSHQVEGNINNDWSEWEKSKKRKRQLERNKLISKYGYENFISRKTCDHYNKYEEDFDIAKKLGHNAHRLSIEWSRIEPEEGKFNEQEIEHYSNVIKALRQRGLEPFVTLWHFTNPVWLKNGWLNKKAVFYFTRYVEKITSAMGDDVKFWITFNEPVTYSLCMYLQQKWIFNKYSIIKPFRQIRQLKKAHKKTYVAIKKINPKAQIGIVNNHTYFTRLIKWDPIEWIIMIAVRYIKNKNFLNSVKNHIDFIGLNYYREIKIDPTFGFFDKKKERNDMGWMINPKGIYYSLLAVKKYKKPIYITENGIPDTTDKKREKYIKEHLYWVWKAIQEGADTRGYLHWSLLDNFEWAHGFWPKFGLVEVNYKTMERKIRKSALAYGEICKRNGM
ncbi:glycoside hydrolase family 1 protein [Patescibacteria group bacterium]